MILRELLYVDVDKVRGLAAQLEEGVPESQTLSRRDNSELGLGAKSLIGFSKSSGGEEKTEKSLGDYMFPLLEDWLESIGLLRDISEELRFQDSWSNIEEIAPLGRIIRVSAPAGLFHPRLVAQALSGFAIAAHGLRDMGILPEGAASSVKPPKAKTPSERRADRAGEGASHIGNPRGT